MNDALQHWQSILEAIIFASSEPISFTQLDSLLQESVENNQGINRAVLKEALLALQGEYAHKAVNLVEVASGYQFRVKSEYASWLAKLSDEKPQRYSRALLETLALIVYRQPVTRAEIEEIRGVAVSSTILRTLIDREWVKVIGHKEVPGKPALLGTTKAFLDYFNLKNLRELPPLEAFTQLEQAKEMMGEIVA